MNTSSDPAVSGNRVQNGGPGRSFRSHCGAVAGASIVAVGTVVSPGSGGAPMNVDPAGQFPHGSSSVTSTRTQTWKSVVLSASSAPTTVLAVEGLTRPRGKTATAFRGEFCAINTCVSINHLPVSIPLESQRLQAAVDATSGSLVLMGWSLGAATIQDRLRQWAANPQIAPDPARVKLVVTFGNPVNGLGGNSRGTSSAVPEGSPYPHLDVTMQYDSVADRPTRWGWYSMINTASARHHDYFDPGVDINDPGNWVYVKGNTTYMLIEADVLPMLKWRDWFTSDAEMARLDAKYRPLVEKDYDRPAHVEQGEGAEWADAVKPVILRDPLGPNAEASSHAGGTTLRSALTEGSSAATRTDPEPDTVAATTTVTDIAETRSTSDELTSARDSEPSATGTASESRPSGVASTTSVRGSHRDSEPTSDRSHRRTGGEPTTDTASNSDDAPDESSADESPSDDSEGGSTAGDSDES